MAIKIDSKQPSQFDKKGVVAIEVFLRIEVEVVTKILKKHSVATHDRLSVLCFGGRAK